MRSIDQDKNAVRQRIWDLLESHQAAPSQVHGKIPDFHGKQEAAQRLIELPAWRSAAVIKAVPDKAQYPARVLALHQSKTVYMAVPRLAAERPFYVLDPAKLSVSPEQAADSNAAAAIAATVDTDEMPPVDVILCGSVAVNDRGARLGKGAGYSDIEVALLQEAGLIQPETIIITTVHDLQILHEELPETKHDFSVDVIVTPTQVIQCAPPRRPTGILWHDLSADKINAIPALAARANNEG